MVDLTDAQVLRTRRNAASLAIITPARDGSLLKQLCIRALFSHGIKRPPEDRRNLGRLPAHSILLKLPVNTSKLTLKLNS